MTIKHNSIKLLYFTLMEMIFNIIISYPLDWFITVIDHYFTALSYYTPSTTFFYWTIKSITHLP